METYRNYTPVAYWDEKLAPVPGWGMRAKFLAGSPRIAVGDTMVSPALATMLAPTQQQSWWSSQSTGMKVAIGVGGVAVVGLVAYLVLK